MATQQRLLPLFWPTPPGSVKEQTGLTEHWGQSEAEGTPLGTPQSSEQGRAQRRAQGGRRGLTPGPVGQGAEWNVGDAGSVCPRVSAGRPWASRNIL